MIKEVRPMATVKETIRQQLLEAASNPDGLEAVLRKHSGSKGPLYLALAEATSQLRGRLEKTASEVAEADKRRDHLLD